MTSCGRKYTANKSEPGSAHDRRHIMTSPGYTGISRRDMQTSAPNIFTNQYDVRENQLHGILKTDITDHFLLFYINCRKSPSSSDDDYKLIRITNGVRTTQYVSKIQNMDWSFLDSFSDCQSYFSNFIKVFKKIYEESFPLIRVKIRYRNRLPWLSDGLKASIKHKNKLYLLSLKHPTLYNISKYKQYRNKQTTFPSENRRKAFLSKPNSTK